MAKDQGQVFKFQLPQAGDMGQALVYNRDRSIQLFKPVEAVAEDMKGRPKAFFRCFYVAGMLVVDHEVADPGW